MNAHRQELERELIAGVYERGSLAFAEMVGFDPGLLSRPHRLAFDAARELVSRGAVDGGPIPATFAAEEIGRLAGAPVAAEVKAAIEVALEGYGGAPVAGELGRLAHALADVAAQADERSSTEVLDASDIFTTLPPVTWLVEALDAAPGAPLLIAGYGFSGKTVAAQDLALAVATGMPAWGTFPAREGRVLHVDFEQGAYLTRLRYQRLARARGIAPERLEGRLQLISMPRWYLDGDAQDELERLCEGVDLLIVDSFRAACPRTDENASEARVPLDRLTRIADRTGVVPVVLHHARKPSGDPRVGRAGGARMTVRGSGALFDACGSVLVFAAEKGEPVTVEHEKARISGRTHEDFRLWVEDVEIDGDPRAGLRVSCLAGGAAKAKGAPDRLAEAKARVLELVQAEVTTGGVNVLRARLGLRKEDVSAAVDELVREGALFRGGSVRAPTLSVQGTIHD